MLCNTHASAVLFETREHQQVFSKMKFHYLGILEVDPKYLF